MIETSTLSALLIVSILYNIMLLGTVYWNVRKFRKWKKYMEQKEQELKRCKMELKVARGWVK